MGINRGKTRVLIIAVALALGVASTAQAASIVYVSNYNVWLANTDGTGQYQVTLDGTASNPYSSPSETSDGTIEAIRGNGSGAQIVRMTQNGTQLNTPFATAVPATGPLDAVLSPDGSKVAYWGVVPVNSCFVGCLDTARTTQISFADHYVDPSTFAPGYTGWSSVGNPAWLSNTRVMLFSGSGTMYYYDLNTGHDYLQWFQESPTMPFYGGCPGGSCSVFFDEGAASQDGTRVAMIIANSNPGYNNPPGQNEYEIILFSANPGDLMTTTPPAQPTLSNCLVHPPDGSQGAVGGSYPGQGPLFDSVSWSPDGSWLTYEYSGTIYTANVASLTDCTQDPIYAIASGSDPYWSSANVNPAPRPIPSAPAPARPTQPGCHTLGHCPPPKSPCAGLAGAALQDCAALQIYHTKLADCDRRFHGKGKRTKAKDASCRKAATTTYHRTLALIKCERIKNKRNHAACVAHARKVR